jgi:hypothetical protein
MHKTLHDTSMKKAAVHAHTQLRECIHKLCVLVAGEEIQNSDRRTALISTASSAPDPSMSIALNAKMSSRTSDSDSEYFSARSATAESVPVDFRKLARVSSNLAWEFSASGSNTAEGSCISEIYIISVHARILVSRDTGK